MTVVQIIEKLVDVGPVFKDEKAVVNIPSEIFWTILRGTLIEPYLFMKA